MNYPLYIFFGLAPSIIWLLFFLRKDSHPESNRMIIKIFLYGMLVTLPIISFWVLTESFNFSKTLLEFFSSSIYIRILYIFLGIALVEEVLKYLVVKEKVLNHSEFDEPVDAVLYMIIAGLGFAALENILVLFSLGPQFLLGETISLAAFRFLGATFLHALCSGLIGYFMALSFYNPEKKRFFFLSQGIIAATLLHGLYNFSIMEMTSNLKFAIPVIILAGLAIFVTRGFKKVKKLKSVCKIT